MKERLTKVESLMKQRRAGKILLLVAIIFCGILSSTLNCMSLNAVAAPPPAKVLRVGSEVSFPPYAFVNQSGEPDGFSVDLFKAVAQSMGINYTITAGPWDTIWSELVSGKITVLPIVAKVPGREQLIDFTLSHTESFDAFFVRTGTQPPKTIAEAQKMTVVVMKSDAAEHQLIARGFSGKIVTVDTIPDGLRLISSGKYPAMLCAKLIGVMAMKSSGIMPTLELFRLALTNIRSNTA